MDKQDELFKWIDENTGSGIVRGKLYFNSFYCDPYILKNKIKELAKEPQKVKVPAFVAEWFEEHKKYLEITLARLMPNIRTQVIQEKRPLTEFEKWANNSGNKPFETIIRMLDGYEVEEEPKWVVLGERGYLTSLSIGKGKSTGWTGNNDKHGSGAIHFEDEETALHTAYITGGTVEKV